MDNGHSKGKVNLHWTGQIKYSNKTQRKRCETA